MVRRLVLHLYVLVSLLSIQSVAKDHPDQTQNQRQFRFVYAFTVTDVPVGKPVRIWFPLATSDTYQTVRVVSVKSDLPSRKAKEQEYGNNIFFAETRKADKSEYHFEVVYDVTRRERVGLRNGEFTVGSMKVQPAVLRRFTAPDTLVPTSGHLAEIAREQVGTTKGDIPRARAMYDYVLATMRYDKSGTGWGRGDSEWACSSKHGNCTDFHSLFASMARSQGIPTRFAIGFPIPASKHSGDIPGYHCWADFYAQQRWIPVDISEASKAPEKKEYFFGAHDANRVQFSIGRDITLSPKQTGKPLNYFVYPYVEVDGAEFKKVRNEFSFADVDVSPTS